MDRPERSTPEPAVASRAFAKLDAALDRFGIVVAARSCADLGCNVGGFTDCLLRRGAGSVIALDVAYGVLAWRLRNDPRVTVKERTNALHAPPPEGGVDLVAIDLGWTPQRLALPAARRWVRPGGEVVTLVKPHYELLPEEKHLLDRGRLADEVARTMVARLEPTLPALGFALVDAVESPIRGGKSGKGRAGEGNLEFLLHLRPR